MVRDMSKNSVDANIDQTLLDQIRESLLNPTGAYLRNKKQVSEINWTWDDGKTTTEIKYVDGKIEKRNNDQAPPTKACHDIAHFMAALNGDMEWDYMQEINHLCEYNAVAIESILTRACHNIMYGIDPDYEFEMQEVFNHLKWFSEKNHKELLNDFLNAYDVDKTVKAFKIFYEVWSIEKMVGNSNFKLKVNMGSDLDFYDKRVYDVIYNGKKFLKSLL
jgi:hypothetical protein